MHEVSEEAVECRRIESGRPRLGLDMDGDTIPQEAGINERAVSFTKGCYVGQETVARLHYKGKPNRHLRGLRLAAPAARGDEILLGERVGGAARLGRASRRGSARSRSRWYAARPRRATRCWWPAPRPRWSSCPSRVTERRDRRRTPRSRHGLSGGSALLGGPAHRRGGRRGAALARPAYDARSGALDLPSPSAPPDAGAARAAGR